MCSYCGCRANTLIRRWSDEHDEIVNALGALGRALADDRPAGQAAAVLAALLEPHTASEERSMFAELRRDPEFAEHVASLCEDHVRIDGLLARVAGGESGAFAELETALRRHIDREENGLFPAAVIALDADAWERAVGLA